MGFYVIVLCLCLYEFQTYVTAKEKCWKNVFHMYIKKKSQTNFMKLIKTLNTCFYSKK